SSASDAWAVGNVGHSATLAEHWDGNRWTAVATASPSSSLNILNGVVALSPTNAWAVGTASVNHVNIALIERWDGTRWSVAPAAAAPGGRAALNAITAVSPTDIWAAGSRFDGATGTFQPLIEHFDGHRWRVVPSPTLPSSQSLLFGIAAASSKDVW